MHKRSLAVVAAVATGVLGLAGTAQARTTGPHPAIALKVKPSTVAAGVATGVNVQSPCPKGILPSSVTGIPAPNGSTTDVQASIAKAPKPVKLNGVWPVPGPSSYTITVSCPGGQSGTGTVKVESAPLPTDITGVGSDATSPMTDQFSADFNAANTTGNGFLYSWDATNPVTGAIGDTIPVKQGCTGIPRPNGGSSGVSALTTENGTTSGHPCIDFARTTSPRSPSNPTTITFVTFAADAVTYAVQPNSNAPAAGLTTADLTGIYNCTITNWKQVGGKSGTIAPFIPFSGSATRSFFLAAIGLSTPGSCVSDDNGTLVESEGTNPVLNTNKANVIVPYSVGKYLAERYHSAACFNTSCTPTGGGLVCTPKGQLNLFGCNTRGTLVLGVLNGTDPTVPWPLTSTTTTAKINTGFTPTFLRLLYNVVASPEFSIPAYLQPLFSSTGWLCTNATAKKDITNYGFLTLPAGTASGDCGSLS